MDEATRRFVLSWVPAFSGVFILLAWGLIVHFQILREERRRGAHRPEPDQNTARPPAG